MLNVSQAVSRLVKLEPLVASVIKKGGNILVIGEWFTLHDTLFNSILGEHPYSMSVQMFSGEWPNNSLKSGEQAKYFNLKKLPSLVFIYDFKNSERMLNEIYFLKIPIVGFVDNKVHPNLILKYLTVVIPWGNNNTAISFLFQYLKKSIELGLFYLNYKVASGSIFEGVLNNVSNLGHSFKNWEFLTKKIFDRSIFNFTTFPDDYTQAGYKTLKESTMEDPKIRQRYSAMVSAQGLDEMFTYPHEKLDVVEFNPGLFETNLMGVKRYFNGNLRRVKTVLTDETLLVEEKLKKRKFKKFNLKKVKIPETNTVRVNVINLAQKNKVTSKKNFGKKVTNRNFFLSKNTSSKGGYDIKSKRFFSSTSSTPKKGSSFDDLISKKTPKSINPVTVLYRKGEREKNYIMANGVMSPQSTLTIFEIDLIFKRWFWGVSKFANKIRKSEPINPGDIYSSGSKLHFFDFNYFNQAPKNEIAKIFTQLKGAGIDTKKSKTKKLDKPLENYVLSLDQNLIGLTEDSNVSSEQLIDYVFEIKKDFVITFGGQSSAVFNLRQLKLPELSKGVTYKSFWNQFKPEFVDGRLKLDDTFDRYHKTIYLPDKVYDDLIQKGSRLQNCLSSCHNPASRQEILRALLKLEVHLRINENLVSVGELKKVYDTKGYWTIYEYASKYYPIENFPLYNLTPTEMQYIKDVISFYRFYGGDIFKPNRDKVKELKVKDD